MEHRIMNRKALKAFARALLEQERSLGTIEKYTRDVRAFTVWLGGAEVTRERAAAWRDSLLERGYAPVTVNSMVAAVNQFFAFLGWEDCKVKALKIQRKLFRDDRKELTREEYQRLLDSAHELGRGAAGIAAGDHLCHRNPGERGKVYHRERPPKWGGRSSPRKGSCVPFSSPASCAGS